MDCQRSGIPVWCPHQSIPKSKSHFAKHGSHMGNGGLFNWEYMYLTVEIIGLHNTEQLTWTDAGLLGVQKAPLLTSHEWPSHKWSKQNPSWAPLINKRHPTIRLAMSTIYNSSILFGAQCRPPGDRRQWIVSECNNMSGKARGASLNIFLCFSGYLPKRLLNNSILSITTYIVKTNHKASIQGMPSLARLHQYCTLNIHKSVGLSPC